MQLQRHQRPATAVSVVAIGGAVLAIIVGFLNPLLALAAAAVALVCGIVAFTRLRSALGFIVLVFSLLPLFFVLFLLYSLAG